MSKHNYIYFLEGGDCYQCAEYNGKEFYEKDEIPKLPIHPNCDCWISILECDDNGKVLPADDKFRKLMRNTMKREGGFEDNPDKIDQPTNMGITSNTLARYNSTHPGYNFPTNVRKLKPEQAEQIYKQEYYDKYRIDEIKNDAVRKNVFDMLVLSGPKAVGEIVQNSLNESVGSNLAIDGVMGTQTIETLNSLSKSQLSEFTDRLINNRLDYLNGLPDSSKYPGWETRTKSYK
jgi:lysozyme family protein